MKKRLGPVDYASAIAPKGYRCGTCDKHGCKLWREHGVFLSGITLECCDCAGKSQEKDVSGIDADGRVLLEPKTYRQEQRCDQIGWRIPAIPTEKGDTYWGYTTAPQAAVNWWRRLPTRV